MITDDLVRALTASTSIVHASTVHAIVVHNYCLAPKLVLPKGSLGGCDVGWKKRLYYSFKWSCVLFLMNSWFCVWYHLNFLPSCCLIAMAIHVLLVHFLSRSSC